MAFDLEIIVGTYENYLIGYRIVQVSGTKKSSYELKQTFNDKSHDGSIRSVYAGGSWIASGGSDDRIFIYDMRTRNQSHVLLTHESTVNVLVFSRDNTHLLSGSEDGRMVATRVGTWQVEGDWRKPHGGKAITHIACHPGSRMALTLGKDLILNTWDLIKGRVVFRSSLKNNVNLGSQLDCLTWSPDGEHFTVSGAKGVQIWEVNSASMLGFIKMPSKPTCIYWVDGVRFLAGLENGDITLAMATKEEEPIVLGSHSNRIKAIVGNEDIVATISSDGQLKIWRFNSSLRKLSLIAETSIECRPTCMTLLNTPSPLISEPAERPAIADSIHIKKSNVEDKISKPSSFVSVEYDQADDIEEGQKKQKSAKKKPKVQDDVQKDGKTKVDQNQENQDDNKNNKGHMSLRNRTQKVKEKVVKKQKKTAAKNPKKKNTTKTGVGVSARGVRAQRRNLRKQSNNDTTSMMQHTNGGNYINGHLPLDIPSTCAAQDQIIPLPHKQPAVGQKRKATGSGNGNLKIQRS